MNLLLGKWQATASEDAFCVLLAHDVVLAPNALQELLKAAASDSRYGILGPAVTYGPSDDKVSLGASWDRWRGARDRRVAPADLPAEAVVPADWVNGSTLLLKAACLRAIGGFNADFFAYWEDVDLCLRAARQGWGVGVVTSAHTHATTRAASSELAAYFATPVASVFIVIFLVLVLFCSPAALIFTWLTAWKTDTTRPTASETTRVGSDSFSGTLRRDPGEAVGTPYAIKQGTLALNSNYILTYLGANLDITKRLVTVTADAKAKTYGDADPALTYQITRGSVAFGASLAGGLTRVCPLYTSDAADDLICLGRGGRRGAAPPPCRRRVGRCA